MLPWTIGHLYSKAYQDAREVAKDRHRHSQVQVNQLENSSTLRDAFTVFNKKKPFRDLILCLITTLVVLGKADSLSAAEVGCVAPNIENRLRGLYNIHAKE